MARRPKSDVELWAEIEAKFPAGQRQDVFDRVKSQRDLALAEQQRLPPGWKPGQAPVGPTAPPSDPRVGVRQGAEAPQSKQPDTDQGTLSRYARAAGDLLPAFRRGLKSSIGAKTFGVEPEMGPEPEPTFLTKTAEGLGNMAGDPYGLAAMAGSAIFPAAAPVLLPAGFAASSGVSAYQRGAGPGEIAGEAALGGVTGAVMGPMGKAGRAVAGPLGSLAGETLAMGPGHTTARDLAIEGRAPTTDELAESAAVSGLTLGAIKGGAHVAQGTLGGFAKRQAGPTEVPITETGEQVPGTGAGGTPADPGAAYRESVKPVYPDLRAQRMTAERVRDAYRQSQQAGDYPSMAMRDLQGQGEQVPPDVQPEIAVGEVVGPGAEAPMGEPTGPTLDAIDAAIQSANDLLRKEYATANTARQAGQPQVAAEHEAKIKEIEAGLPRLQAQREALAAETPPEPPAVPQEPSAEVDLGLPLTQPGEGPQSDANAQIEPSSSASAPPIPEVPPEEGPSALEPPPRWDAPTPRPSPMSRLDARLQSDRSYRALSDQADRLYQQLDEARRTGLAHTQQQIEAALDQVEARMDAIKAGLERTPEPTGEPPGESPATGPEPTPPLPEAPPEYIPEEAPPPETEPVPPSLMGDTAARRALETHRASRVSPDEIAQIERRARGAIPPEEITHRTNDEVLAEIQREQETLRKQLAGEEIPPPEKRAGQDELVDLTLTPEQRQARIDELMGNLRERMSYPRPVNELITGQRGLYVQVEGTGPLRQIAKDHYLGYAKAGPFEVAWHENALTEQDVRTLAARGLLERFVEPDVRWETGGPVGPGKIGVPREPPPTNRDIDATAARREAGPPVSPPTPYEPPQPIDRPIAAQLRQLLKRPPLSRKGQEGMLFPRGKRTWVVAKHRPLPDPALEAEFAHEAPGFKDRWVGRYEATKKGIKDTFGPLFQFADDIAPRHFKSDPLLNKPEVYKQLSIESELAGRIRDRGHDFAVAQIDRIMKPILTSPWQERKADLEAWRRIVGMGDKVSDAGRGIDVGKPEDVLQANYQDAWDHASDRVKQSVTEYRKVMREQAQDGVDRGWFTKAVLERETYFPHLMRDLSDAIQNLYNFPGLREVHNSWRKTREEGPHPEQYADMIGDIHKRLMSQKMAGEIEDLAKRVLPLVDVLPKLSIPELAENFGTNSRADARRALRAGNMARPFIVVRDAHGNPIRYVPFAFAKPGAAKLGIPRSYEESLLYDRAQKREGLTETYLVNERVAKHLQDLIRPRELSEFGKRYDKFERFSRASVLIGRGVKGIASDTASDVYALLMHTQFEHAQSAGRFGKELTEWLAKGTANLGRKAVGAEKAENPPPFLIRVMQNIGHALDTPEDRAFRELVQKFDILNSTFYGNPGEHMMERRLQRLQDVGKLPLSERLVKNAGRAVLQGAEGWTRGPQYLSALQKVFIGHGAAMRLGKGKTLRSYDLDIDGLPSDYQIGALMRGALQNYDRLPEKLQRSVGRTVARFIGFPYWEGKKFGRRINETVMPPALYRQFKAVAQTGDLTEFRPAVDTAMRVGSGVLATYLMRQHFKDVWDDFKAAGGWASDLMFAFPLTRKNEDGDAVIAIPSVGVDYAPHVIVAKALAPAVKERMKGKITDEEFLARIAPDLVKGFGKELTTRLVAAVSIPAGLYMNKDFRTGAEIVPGSRTTERYRGLEYSETGQKLQAAWVMNQVLAVYGQMLKTWDRAAQSKDVPPGQLGTTLAVAQNLIDPTGSLLYKVDPTKLHYDAINTRIEANIPYESETNYRLDQATGQAMAGHPEVLGAEMATIKDQVKRGRLPAVQAEQKGGTARTSELLASYRQRLQEAGTAPEREAIRQQLRSMRQLQSMVRLKALAKRHPSATAMALKDLQPDLVPNIGEVSGGR